MPVAWRVSGLTTRQVSEGRMADCESRSDIAYGD